MKRSGFTLVELLVSATLGIAIFGGALLIWSASNRSRSVGATARGLQTALIIQEQIVSDLGRLVQIEQAPVRVAPGAPSRMSFYAFDPEASKEKRIAVHAVVYALAGPPGMLQREWQGKVSPVGVSPLNAITFSPFFDGTGALVRVTLEVGREPGEPPGPPTTHSFLVRLLRTYIHPTLEVEVATSFRDPRDKPGQSELLSP